MIICVTEARRATEASGSGAGDENEGCGGELKTSLTITGVVSICSGPVCLGVFSLGLGMKSDMEKLYYFSLSLSARRSLSTLVVTFACPFGFPSGCLHAKALGLAGRDGLSRCAGYTKLRG